MRTLTRTTVELGFRTHRTRVELGLPVLAVRRRDVVRDDACHGRFVTVAEIAQVLKLNQQTVRNWIDAGQLPAIRIGRRVRIRREDFQTLLDRGLDLSGGLRSERLGGYTAEAFWSGELLDQTSVEPRN